MNRICIFSLYDKNGIVDEYVFYMLESLGQVTNRVIVVVNGSIQESCFIRLKSAGCQVYVRENLGYDVGGYKDVIISLFEDGDINEYDEIILLNDTFFGPFWSWKTIFRKMDEEPADFWGIIRMDETVYGFPFILSFFQVFRSGIIHSCVFKDYWKKLDYPTCFSDATELFERGMAKVLLDAGYKNYSYLEAINKNFKYDSIGPYIADSYIYIREKGMPILKRKSLGPMYYENAKRTLEFIKTNLDYDISLILDNCNRLENEHSFRPLGYKEIEEFCSLHNKIYLYGNGTASRALSRYLQYIHVKIESYIVSKKTNDEEGVVELKNVRFHDGDGVIIATFAKYSDEIYNSLLNRLAPIHILKPKF